MRVFLACDPSAFDQLANRATKWTLTGLATGFVICHRCDPASMWFITGALVNGTANKFLKRSINQRRPIGSFRFDPGMPSSHAQSLAFFSTYSTIGIAGANPGVYSILPCVILLGCAAYLAFLRVSTGFHTTAQVAAGLTIGSFSAVIWKWIWMVVLENCSMELSWMSKAVWGVLFLAGSLSLWRSSE